MNSSFNHQAPPGTQRQLITGVPLAGVGAQWRQMLRSWHSMRTLELGSYSLMNERSQWIKEYSHQALNPGIHLRLKTIPHRNPWLIFRALPPDTETTPKTSYICCSLLNWGKDLMNYFMNRFVPPHCLPPLKCLFYDLLIIISYSNTLYEIQCMCGSIHLISLKFIFF